jgi:predicted metal-dependent enzyme (double-stranded beta helix superfamily)
MTVNLAFNSLESHLTHPSKPLPDPAQQYEVSGAGVVRRMGSPAASLLRRFSLRRPYRLYRFLSHLEDLVGAVRDERERLRLAAVLVRHLLAESAWIAESCPVPDPALGWAVSFLYDEPGYPFTVQLVSWLPDQGSPVHNHAAWGIVALLGDPAQDGHEENTLWRQTEQGGVEKTGILTLKPGDLIGFTPEAIHSVQAVDPVGQGRPTLTFNVYGETDFSQRYEYDPADPSATSAQLF